MSNVRDIGGVKKPCPYCGAEKACPDFTCPRIASVWSDDQGAWEITFFPPQSPPDGDEAA